MNWLTGTVDKAIDAGVSLRLRAVVGNVLVVSVYFVLLIFSPLLPEENYVQPVAATVLLIALVVHVGILLTRSFFLTDGASKKRKRK